MASTPDRASEERFHVELELSTCRVSADFAGCVPQNPSTLASRIANFVAQHPKVREENRKVRVLDRSTGHYYEIDVEEEDPDGWIWTRLTFALAPIRARDPSAVFSEKMAPVDWRESRTGTDRARHIEAAFGRRKTADEMTETES